MSLFIQNSRTPVREHIHSYLMHAAAGKELKILRHVLQPMFVMQATVSNDSVLAKIEAIVELVVHSINEAALMCDFEGGHYDSQ
jgi:hypothetical protein